MSAANLPNCSVRCLSGKPHRTPCAWDSAHYCPARTNSVNSRNSAWFKSETADFIALLVQEKTLYPRWVTTVGEVLRLVAARRASPLKRAT